MRFLTSSKDHNINLEDFNETNARVRYAYRTRIPIYDIHLLGGEIF
ncbi:hypothetical protein M899_0414 [Bacteriovorax sp. BSW11_IV]|nr:hypothetical protein M899_0414 [Bacteriovorax sp. BSW11_IV]